MSLPADAMDELEVTHDISRQRHNTSSCSYSLNAPDDERKYRRNM
jgi:hypothetical protein